MPFGFFTTFFLSFLSLIQNENFVHCGKLRVKSKQTSLLILLSDVIYKLSSSSFTFFCEACKRGYQINGKRYLWWWKDLIKALLSANFPSLLKPAKKKILWRKEAEKSSIILAFQVETHQCSSTPPHMFRLPFVRELKAPLSIEPALSIGRD